MKEILEKLIAVKSLSGSESDIFSLIKSSMPSTAQQYEDSSWITCVQRTTSNATRCLIIHGHVDTVPANLGEWETDPFKLTEKDGKLFGLGASDMKSGIAVMLELLKTSLQTSNDVDVWFVFTAMEEIDGKGAQEFCKWFEDGEKKRYTVIEAITLEPTDNENYALGHRGNYAFECTLYGQSGHGSDPTAVTDPAIEKAFRAIKEFGELKAVWEKLYFDPSIGAPNLNITSFSAGNKMIPNQFPDRASFVIDIRSTPSLETKLNDELNKVKNHFGSSLKLTEIIHPSKAVSTSHDSRLATILGKRLNQSSFSGATDLSYFAEIGIGGVVFGPGNSKTMHIPNENLLAGSMEKVFAVLKQVVEEY